MGYANKTRIETGDYQPPEDPCPDGNGIYLPKNIWKNLATEVARHDVISSGLEQIQQESTMVPLKITEAFTEARCLAYQMIGAYLVTGPWKGKDGKLY